MTVTKRQQAYLHSKGLNEGQITSFDNIGYLEWEAKHAINYLKIIQKPKMDGILDHQKFTNYLFNVAAMELRQLQKMQGEI